MANRKLQGSSYKKLVTDIVRLFEGVHRSLIEAGWKTGQWIVEVEQGGDVRATRGDQLLSTLSEDLARRLGSGFSVQSLRRMRRFYLNNPKRSPASVITWAHHIELLPVRNKKTRLVLERRAERDELDRDSLRALVRRELVREKVEKNLAASPETREPPDLLPVPRKGRLNTYRIKDPNETAWPDKKVLLLDHGFKGYRALTSEEIRGPNTDQSKRNGTDSPQFKNEGNQCRPSRHLLKENKDLGGDWGRPNYRYGKEMKSLGGLKAGDVVEWTGAKLVKSGGTVKDLFTYRAYLESAVDGDTLWVVLDIGTREISRQKLRLRGIDCPEINTKEGLAAKKFVEAVLKDVPYLTVLSSKNATYDRYEADVFFNDKDGKEIYLNNLLLQEGYAVRVRS